MVVTRYRDWHPFLDKTNHPETAQRAVLKQILGSRGGAFGTRLLAYDLCEPALMFGQAGCLSDDSCFERPGLGLMVRVRDEARVSGVT